MNPELKARWLEALRSGRYEQGVEYLCQEYNGKREYCCLGVLCDVAGIEFRSTDDEDGIQRNVLICELGYETLNDMGAYFGLTPDQHEVCYLLNDGQHGGIEVARKYQLENRPHTFAEIADWIEKNV